MSFYEALWTALRERGQAQWADLLDQQINARLASSAHGDWARWNAVIDALPSNQACHKNLVDAVEIGTQSELNDQHRNELQALLMGLHPWRKGPYDLFGIKIDTEWRSDWKWARLEQAITPLSGRWVLDVGCGNGYHAWRMLGAGAKRVVGIDPTLLSVAQFLAIKKLHGPAAVDVLPIGIEDLPPQLKLFDTVFSMGVLYHRRSPIDHLYELRQCLRPGGELVIETLVIDGDQSTVLVPGERYAQMRNVWFLPSCSALMHWMSRCGFRNIRLIDCCKTTVDEQRSTDWMRFHSLAQFLNPLDSSLTIEGWPAPQRAIFIANID